jgi:hypothetical protein
MFVIKLCIIPRFALVLSFFLASGPVPRSLEQRVDVGLVLELLLVKELVRQPLVSLLAHDEVDLAQGELARGLALARRLGVSVAEKRDVLPKMKTQSILYS